MTPTKTETLVCDICGRDTDAKVSDSYEYRPGHARRCYLSNIRGFWGKGCAFLSLTYPARAYYEGMAKERNAK